MDFASNNDNDFIAFKSNPSSFICTPNGSISICNEGNLFSFGLNKNCFLGHEEMDDKIYPSKQNPNLHEIKMITCGYNHTVCIDYDGKLFTFGNNGEGILGIGKTKQEFPFTHIPQQIIDIHLIDYVSCGHDFTICIANDRTAFSFGKNKCGQLGLGTNNLYLSPQLISDLNDIEIIQCGGNHTICKTYSNEYYSWGSNYDGELGQGNNVNYNKPIKCSNWPEDIVDIKCGYNHILLLTSAGYVYSFGDNHYGQLGLNDKNISQINIPTLIKDIPLIKRIECGYHHAMCIDVDNNLWMFGFNGYGQLGLGDYQSRYKLTLNESLHDIIDISSGLGNHTFVKTINNEIHAFGNNQHSQLGIKTSKMTQSNPTQVFKDNEDIWGSNTRRSKQKSARK